jgi:hypothetical protein
LAAGNLRNWTSGDCLLIPYKQLTEAYQAFTNLGDNKDGNRKKDAMTEEQNQTPSLQEAERYYSEHVQLDSEIAGSPNMALQESMNKGARQSWRLVGVVQDPTGKGAVFLVWDTTGFFSG